MDVVMSGTGADTALPFFDFSGAPVASLVQVVLTLVIPMLVALVTDRLSAGALKVALHGGLSMVTAFLNQLLTALLDPSVAFDWVNALGNGVLTWLVGIVVYRGILKPSGAAAKAQDAPLLQLFGPSKQGRHEA